MDWSFFIHKNLGKGKLKLECPWTAPDVNMSGFPTVLQEDFLAKLTSNTRARHDGPKERQTFIIF